MSDKLLVLVIEENAHDFELLKSYIEAVDEYHATIVWKKNYKSGCDFFIKAPIDICFLDCKMGQETGLDFLRQVKHHKKETPIILIGNHAGEQIEKIYEDDGINDFIYRKSLSTALIKHSLRYGLENHQQSLELRAQEEKYSKLFYNSLEAIFTADQNYRILEANKSFKKLIGLDRLTNFDFEKLFIQGDFDLIFNVSEDKEKRKVHRTKIKNKHGVNLDVYIAISLILSEDNGTFYQGIIHDITELEQAQTKVVESENLKLIGRMARVIGHEVRNPLTNIVLATEEMRQDLAKNEDALLMLDMIQRNSNRISGLIDNFLNHTKNTEFEKAPVAVKDVVQEAIENCRDRILLLDIDLQTSGLALDENVHLDREKMVIALTNILINAVEVLEEKEHAQLKISLEIDSELVYIIIQDNGPGMTEETKEQLFNPFYSSKQGGLGLGMTNTKHIINMHQGTIHLKTRLNEGTTFTIELPR